MNSVMNYLKDLNIYSILLFLLIIAILIGVFYYQKYMNDCLPTISSNIKKHIDNALSGFPSLNELFKNINFDSYIDNYINDQIEENLDKYAAEFEKYGVSKEELRKLSEDKELRGKVTDYIKQNGYKEVMNNPEKQEEVKKMFVEYISEKGDPEQKKKLNELTDKINNQKVPVPTNLNDEKDKLNPGRINDVVPGTYGVSPEAQVKDFEEFSEIPNRYQDNIYTGAVPLTYLKG